MSRRSDADTHGGYRYEPARVVPTPTPTPTPRKSLALEKTYSPISSEIGITPSSTTAVAATQTGGKGRDEVGPFLQSRQFLSPDVGYGYHHHHHHHHHQQQQPQQGGGVGPAGTGGTNLERVPSTSRLQPQSSTETSGLGETVTSGFSSQESVHSAAGYAADAMTPTGAPDGGKDQGGRRNPHPHPPGADRYSSTTPTSPLVKPSANPITVTTTAHNPASASTTQTRTRHDRGGGSSSTQGARHLAGPPQPHTTASSDRHAHQHQQQQQQQQQQQRSSPNRRSRERGREGAPEVNIACCGSRDGPTADSFSGERWGKTFSEEEGTGVSGGAPARERRNTHTDRRRDPAVRRGGSGDGGAGRGGGGGGSGEERTVASETAERGISVTGARTRAAVVGDIDRGGSSSSTLRVRHRQAGSAAATVDSSGSARERRDSGGKREVCSPVFRHSASPDRGKDWTPERSADKAASLSRRDKDKGSSSRSSSQDKSLHSASSSKDRAVRSPEKSFHRDGSRDGSNSRNRRESPSSSFYKRDSPVSKEHASHRQHEVYSLADNGAVRDASFVYSSKASAHKDSQAVAGKEHSREWAVGSEADIRRKEKALEKQKSRDSGLGRVVDREPAKEATRGPLEKQSSRDSGTGRSLEGQSPREVIGLDACDELFPSSVVPRDPNRPRGHFKDRSRTVEEVPGTDPAGDYRHRERALPKHSSADAATTKTFRKSSSKGGSLERHTQLQDSRLSDLEQPRDNPFRQVLKEATPGHRDRPTSLENTRANPQNQPSRERSLDRLSSVDEINAKSQRQISRERTGDRQASLETRRPKADQRSEHHHRQYPATDLVDRKTSLDRTGGREIDHRSPNPHRQISREERSQGRQTSTEETTEAVLGARRDHHRQVSRERKPGTRTAVDEIQLQERHSVTRTSHRPAPAERTPGRERSLEEETSFGDTTDVREKDRRSAPDDRIQASSDAGSSLRNVDKERKPQRRISRDRTLDRQFSIDESRQFGRDEDEDDPHSRRTRPVSEQQSREKPVPAERRVSQENPARQGRSDSRREPPLRVHRHSSQDADTGGSSEQRVKGPRQLAEDAELKTSQGRSRGDEPRSLHDVETERRGAVAHRERRESDRIRTVDKRRSDRQDSGGLSAGALRDTGSRGVTATPDSKPSRRADSRSSDQQNHRTSHERREPSESEGQKREHRRHTSVADRHDSDRRATSDAAARSLDRHDAEHISGSRRERRAFSTSVAESPEAPVPETSEARASSRRMGVTQAGIGHKQDKRGVPRADASGTVTSERPEGRSSSRRATDERADAGVVAAVKADERTGVHHRLKDRELESREGAGHRGSSSSTRNGKPGQVDATRRDRPVGKADEVDSPATTRPQRRDDTAADVRGAETARSTRQGRHSRDSDRFERRDPDQRGERTLDERDRVSGRDKRERVSAHASSGDTRQRVRDRDGSVGDGQERRHRQAARREGASIEEGRRGDTSTRGGERSVRRSTASGRDPEEQSADRGRGRPPAEEVGRDSTFTSRRVEDPQQRSLEGRGRDLGTSTTSSARPGPTAMGSDGRKPRGQRQQPPRTIVTVTSPTSPDNVFNNQPVQPHPNGDVSRRSRQHRHSSAGDEVFDDLFSQARTLKGQGQGGGGVDGRAPGLQVEQINHEWERRESRGSIRSNRSRSSHAGSFRSRSGSLRHGGKGLFLGVHTESAWTRWSRDRRASFRRRIELLEKPEQNLARVSTPVRKARQEGLKFVAPDLEGTFLSEEDLNELRRHKQQKYHAIRVIEKSRKGKFRMKTEVHLTAEQWQVISDFWDHPAFVRGRYLGLFLMFVSFIVMIVSIAHGSWVSYEAWNLTICEGLWVNCSTPILTAGDEKCVATDGRGFSGGIWSNCYQNLSDAEAEAKCPEKRPHWQNAVIGLMIFSAAFGVLASVLSICGVCTTPLPRKIYYFHSAGEIFLICALSTGVALLVFPIAVEIDRNISSHRYGIGYGLGWGGAFFFLAAAVCMSLDDLVREASRTKCCKWCWKSKHNDRTELRQV